MFVVSALLTRALTQRGGRGAGHAARVSRRGAASAGRRRVPEARGRRARQHSAGRRQGNYTQAHERQRRRGERVAAVHARGRGARGRRAGARHHRAHALQRRRRPHGPRVGLHGGRGVVARLVRRQRGGAGGGRRRGGGGRGGPAPGAGRRRGRRAHVRHPLPHARHYALVVRRDGSVPGGARRGRGGGRHGAGARAAAPPLHRRRRQAAPLGPAHDGVREQAVDGARGGRDVPGRGARVPRRLGGHRLQGPLRAHARHAVARLGWEASNRWLMEPPHYDGVQALALCQDDSALYSASRDTSLKRWSLADRTLTHGVMNAHKGWVTGVCVVGSGADALVGSCGRDAALRVWSGALRPAAAAALPDLPHALRAHPDHTLRTLYTAGNGGEVRSWRITVEQ